MVESMPQQQDMIDDGEQVEDGAEEVWSMRDDDEAHVNDNVDNEDDGIQYETYSLLILASSLFLPFFLMLSFSFFFSPSPSTPSLLFPTS